MLVIVKQSAAVIAVDFPLGGSSVTGALHTAGAPQQTLNNSDVMCNLRFKYNMGRIADEWAGWG